MPEGFARLGQRGSGGCGRGCLGGGQSSALEVWSRFLNRRGLACRILVFLASRLGSEGHLVGQGQGGLQQIPRGAAARGLDLAARDRGTRPLPFHRCGRARVRTARELHAQPRGQGRDRGRLVAVHAGVNWDFELGVACARTGHHGVVAVLE